MVTTLPRAVRVWNRGQMTIPKEVRQAIGVKGDTFLQVFAVGRCLVMTPKKLERAVLSGEIENDMKRNRLTLNGLLAHLKGERRRYNRERHGK
ncbi:MAG: AbrB/MazE/SpoVT family DNA-binding domain-containing protein [Planctomycetota bacterium]